MKKLAFNYTFLIIYYLFINQSFGQSVENTPVGHFYDINGTHIDGFLDIEYEPEAEISKFGQSTNGKSYYYNLNGDKIYGEIMLFDDASGFKFKVRGDSKFYDIKTEDFKSVVINKDSFAVVNQFLLNGEEYHNRFVKVLKQIGDHTFYEYSLSSTHYLVKRKGADEILHIPNNGKHFKSLCTTIFAKVPSIVEGIQTKKFKNKHDIPEMIKMLEYKSKLDEQAKIHFTRGWKEIEGGKPYFYYGKVTNLQDSIWSISYYDKQDRKIYDGQYSSLKQMRKNGVFKWYYPNGQLRKMAVFKNDAPAEKYKTYYENGTLHYSYSYSKEGVKYYHSILSKDAIELLNENGEGEELLEDSKMKRQVIVKYEGHHVKYAYYEDSNKQKTYLKVDMLPKIKAFKALASNMQEVYQYPQKAINKDIQGHVLISMIIDEKGSAYNHRVISGIDPQCDKLALNIMKQHAALRGWKPAKLNSKKVQSEVVVPVSFLIGYPPTLNFDNYDSERMYKEAFLHHLEVNYPSNNMN